MNFRAFFVTLPDVSNVITCSHLTAKGFGDANRLVLVQMRCTRYFMRETRPFWAFHQSGGSECLLTLVSIRFDGIAYVTNRHMSVTVFGVLQLKNTPLRCA